MCGCMQEWISILKGEKPDMLANSETDYHWLSINDVKEPNSREIANTELLFDIDGKDFNKARMLANNLEDYLFEKGIPFLRFTSGRLFHYSVFIKHKSTYNPSHLKDYYKYNKSLYDKNTCVNEFSHLMRYAIFKDIIRYVAPVDGAEFDLGLMKSAKHLIRICGGKHKNGYYKSFLDLLPQTPPLIKKDEVVYPNKIIYWNVDDTTSTFAYKEHLKPYFEEEAKPERKGKIKWIEKIFDMELKDGRHRIVNSVLAPYMVNVLGTNVNEATERIFEWIKKNKELSYTQITKSYVLYQVKYAKKRGLQPLAKKSIKHYFSDAEMVKKITGDKYDYSGNLRGLMK